MISDELPTLGPLGPEGKEGSLKDKQAEIVQRLGFLALSLEKPRFVLEGSLSQISREQLHAKSADSEAYATTLKKIIDKLEALREKQPSLKEKAQRILKVIKSFEEKIPETAEALHDMERKISIIEELLGKKSGEESKGAEQKSKQEEEIAPPGHEYVKGEKLIEPASRFPGQALAPDVASKMERMDRLLTELEKDLQDDISGLPEEAFLKRVDKQFNYFIEIANVRQSLKEYLKKDPSLSLAVEVLTKRYKTFIQQQPSFREAAAIKEGLGIALKSELTKGSIGAFDVPVELSKEVLPVLGWKANLLVQMRAAAKHDVSRGSKIEWKKTWRGIQKSLLEGAQRARPLLQDASLTKKHFTWMTGTTSATLVPMLQMSVPEIGCPALIPTGQLLRYGIVPLTGELRVGISEQGVNIGGISGVPLSQLEVAQSYARDCKKISLFDFSAELGIVKQYDSLDDKIGFFIPPNRIKIAVLRLLFAKEQGLPVDAALGETKAHITECLAKLQSRPVSQQWETFGGLVGHNVEPGGKQGGAVSPGMVVGIKRSDGTVKYAVVSLVDKEEAKCVAEMDGASKPVNIKNLLVFEKRELETACQWQRVGQNSLTSDQRDKLIPKNVRIAEALNECLSILEGKRQRQFRKLTPEDERLIRTPVGLIFGSFTDQSRYALGSRFIPVRPSPSGEILAMGPQRVGEEIQVVFVEEPDLERVKEYIQKNLPSHVKIHVVGMRALSYLPAWSVYSFKLKS